jgi:hypothetical protein
MFPRIQIRLEDTTWLQQKLGAVYTLSNYSKFEYVFLVAGPRDRERVAADHGRHARTRTRVPAAPGGGAQVATAAAGSAAPTPL